MKKYLCVSKSVLSVVHIDGGQELLGGLLTVNKLAFRDRTGIQNAVSATEIQ